jgi:hypothetical protein
MLTIVKAALVNTNATNVIIAMILTHFLFIFPVPFINIYQ